MKSWTRLSDFTFTFTFQSFRAEKTGRETTWEATTPDPVCPHVVAAAAAKLLQLCLTLCDPIDGSLPGFTVPEILQARTLEWIAISFSNA